MSRLFKLLDHWLHRFEDGVLTLLLGGMILLAASQIVLRNFFDAGFLWADPLLRILVLWLGLVGAVAATRDRRHINIDILSRFMSGRWVEAAQVLSDIFAAAVCALVAWYSFDFVRGEAEYGLRGLANLPVWWFEAIIPLAFGVMALRFLAQGVVQIPAVIKGSDKS